MDDNGANLKSGSTYDKRNFISYSDCKHIEYVTGAGGEAHRMHGYGNIQLEISTTTGKQVVLSVHELIGSIMFLICSFGKVHVYCIWCNALRECIR
jgi:hypothetical protein